MKQDKLQHLSQEELERLIDRYFECDLSDAQEQQLKQELAVTAFRSDNIDEARFTMGFMSAGMRLHRGRGSNVNGNRTWKIVSAAASVILILAVGLGVRNVKLGQDEACYAYVKGHKVSNESEVMALIHNDLDEVHIASSGIDDRMLDQLASMGDALEIEN